MHLGFSEAVASPPELAGRGTVAAMAIDGPLADGTGDRVRRRHLEDRSDRSTRRNVAGVVVDGVRFEWQH